MLHIEEEKEEDPMSQSDSSSLLAEAEAVSRIVTVQLERVSSLFSFLIVQLCFIIFRFNTVASSYKIQSRMEAGQHRSHDQIGPSLKTLFC